MKAIIEDILYTGLGAASLNADRFLKSLDKASYDMKVAEEEGQKLVQEWETASQERRNELEDKFEALSQNVKQSLGKYSNEAEDLTEALENKEAATA